MKLALALFAPFAVSLAATGQTSTTTTPATTTTPVHHSTSASSATSTTSATKAKTAAGTASTIPKVVGIPHTLYSLKYIDIKIGTGALAEPNKWYSVNYTGWFPDGKKFDSSYDHTPKEPITFPYGAKRVITGWDTGFEGMHIGGKRRLFVPYELAYGLLGNPAHGMPAKANLVFDVELVSISDTPPASMTQRPGAGRPGAAANPAGAPPAPGTPAPAPAPGTKPAVDPASVAPAKPATDPTAPTTSPTPAPATPPSGK